MSKYSLESVEKQSITVNDYLNYKLKALKPYKFKKASGLRMAIMYKNYLFLSPKMPFWILNVFKKRLIKISNNRYIEMTSPNTINIVELLKMLGKNNLILEVQSSNEPFRFELWGA